LIGLAFGLGKIVRDCSLTCNVGYQLAPVAIIAIALLSIPVSVLAVRFANSLGYKRWQMWSLGLIALGFFVFWAATNSIIGLYPESSDTFVDNGGKLPVRLIYLGFFVWIGAVGTIIAPNIKSTVYRVFKTSGQTKALAITNAAVIIGGLIGGILANLVVPLAMRNLGLRFEMARDLLILSMGIVILSILPVIAIIDKLCCRVFNETGFIHPQEELPIIFSDLGQSNFRKALQWIRSDNRIMRMAFIISLRGVSETVLIYLFYWLVAEQTPAVNGRTLFFADFYILLNAGTLLILLMGTNRLIDRYGLVFSLITLPVALFLGSVYLIFNIAMVVTYVLRIVDTAFEQSFYFQGVDRLLLEVDESRASYVRPILQGLAVRVGRGVGAALILVLALGIGVSASHMAVFLAAILLIWIAAVISLHRHQRGISS
jgi:ATP/ADP translocase